MNDGYGTEGKELTVGQLLERVREERWLSLEEVGRATSIPVDHLEALERKDFAALPEAGATSLLRIYADHLGLDGEELAWRLENQELDGQSPVSTGDDGEEAESGGGIKSLAAYMSKTMVSAVMMVVVLAAGVLVLTVLGPDSEVSVSNEESLSGGQGESNAAQNGGAQSNASGSGSNGAAADPSASSSGGSGGGSGSDLGSGTASGGAPDQSFPPAEQEQSERGDSAGYAAPASPGERSQGSAPQEGVSAPSQAAPRSSGGGQDPATGETGNGATGNGAVTGGGSYTPSQGAPPGNEAPQGGAQGSDPGTGDPGTGDPGTGDPGTGDPGTGDPGTGPADDQY